AWHCGDGRIAPQPGGDFTAPVRRATAVAAHVQDHAPRCGKLSAIVQLREEGGQAGMVFGCRIAVESRHADPQQCAIAQGADARALRAWPAQLREFGLERVLRDVPPLQPYELLNAVVLEAAL